MSDAILMQFKNKYGSASAAPETKNKKKIQPDYKTDFSEWDDYKHVQAIENYFGYRNPYSAPRSGKISSCVTFGDEKFTSFCSYNYVGLNGSEEVEAAVVESLKKHGSSASASRVAGGECEIHREFEKAIAGFIGCEEAIATVGGYIANVATIRYLMGENDLILFDELCHNSLVEGCASSKARRMKFKHNDNKHLNDLLTQQRGQYRRVLIVVESVYSMDGDIIDLSELVEIKKRHSAFLMVDEAHSIGTLGDSGRGLCEYAKVNPADVDVIMGTMSKSLSSCGGFMAGSKALIGLLRYIAPGYLLYSAGIPPSSCAASLAVIRRLSKENDRVKRLQYNADKFREIATELGLDIGLSKDSPIVPIMLGGAGDSIEKMAEITRELFLNYVHVVGITYPVVPRDQARLRFFITSEHTEAQMREALNITRNIINSKQEVSHVVRSK